MGIEKNKTVDEQKTQMYHIVRAFSLTELSGIVHTFLNEGYTLVGSVGETVDVKTQLPLYYREVVKVL